MMTLHFLLLTLCLPLAVEAIGGSLSAGPVGGVLTADQKCSLQGETLTMFNTETAPVKIPCKYRLADFTCGGYHVKATPGSDWNGTQVQFVPEKIWVKVTYNDQTWEGRSTEDQVNQASDEYAWTPQDTNTLALSNADYVGSYARLLMKDNLGNKIFKVKFSPSEIEVICYAGNSFTSDSYPHSLCGSKDALIGVIGTLRDQRFPGYAAGSEADDWVIIYDVLEGNHIRTNSRCLEVAEEFRENCDGRQAEALKNCGPVFTEDSKAVCLVGEANDLSKFTECLKSWCDPSGSHLLPTCPT